MKIGKISTLIGMGALAVAATVGAAQAGDLPSVKEPLAAPVAESALPWFVKLGVGGVIFNSSANLALGGVGVPGASATASNNVTAIIQFGYYVTDNFSLQLTAGYPPTTSLTAAGSIAPFGKLGEATYGPAVLSVDYHFTNFGAFQPYIGAGVVDALILNTRGAFVHNLSIGSQGGAAVEGGFDYFINRNWSVFVDAKYLFLTVAANATALGAPLTATIHLNPVIVSGGVGYHF
jgi:outer membrane protein